MLQTRRSCRGYLPDEVPKALIESIVRAAQWAPSWSNVQPWQVDVVSGEVRDRLTANFADESIERGPDVAFPRGYTGIYRDRRRTSGWQLYDALGITRGDRAASAAEASRNFEFFGAPHAAIVSTERALGEYGILDCGLFIQAFLTAAEAAGLGTIAQASVASRSPTLHEQLSIPSSRAVLCAIAFGYPDPSHPSARVRTERAPLDEVVRFH
ncbi:nitroreductase [Rhodococcus sp. USK10]|uniref:nitroreductase n=1 Tax=Rhodococcus sp. USK10 TaxID=2789739 RepID=UPI002150FB14|nr:nitroreductase [Rhodococcus sp. USK10]